MLDGKHDETWREDLRSCAPADLIEQLRSIWEVVEGMAIAAEGVNFATMLALRDCKVRVMRAARLAYEHAERAEA